MAETAAHLVEQVIPWVATRQWVVSVPIPLRYWMAASTHLMAQVHTIICRTIHQYDVNQAVKQGHIHAHRRDQLERLIRYTARGAVSLERLAQDAHGDLLYTFTRAELDSTTGI